ncbi:MAG: CoA transferase [Gammaproteobacteria bacterium]|nr:CoA transferase [Gammaproteobacteria bacterium]
MRFGERRYGSRHGMFLSGIRVLDIGSYVAGPAAATVMSDFGADIVKVEPLAGDPYRTLLGGVLAEYPNFFWDQDSRNKRSLSIDFTTDAGRDAIDRLIARSDVVITNYRPELLARLKLSYEDVRALNESVIYGQVNSYGLDGPDANRTGFDATAWWARSGLMDHVRRPNGAHAVSSPGMGDHPTSMSLFGGIMAALYRRQRTGEGAHVHTSLLANGAWSHCMMIQGALIGFDLSDQRSPDDVARAPLAAMYRTRDDRTILLSILNPEKEWPKFAAALGHEEWVDDARFVDRVARYEHREELYEALVAAFGSDTVQTWRDRLDGAGITYSVAQTISEVVNDEQMYVNDVLTEVEPGDHFYAYTVNSPFWMNGASKRTPRLAPGIGEHTTEVLKEIGFDDAEINAMLDDGIARQREGK